MLRRGWAETKILFCVLLAQRFAGTSATRGGSCAHPDQSRGLARNALVRNDLCAEASSLILPFFIGGGEPIHEGLVGGIIATVLGFRSIKEHRGWALLLFEGILSII